MLEDHLQTRKELYADASPIDGFDCGVELLKETAGLVCTVNIVSHASTYIVKADSMALRLILIPVG